MKTLMILLTICMAAQASNIQLYEDRPYSSEDVSLLNWFELCIIRNGAIVFGLVHLIAMPCATVHLNFQILFAPRQLNAQSSRLRISNTGTSLRVSYHLGQQVRRVGARLAVPPRV